MEIAAKSKLKCRLVAFKTIATAPDVMRRTEFVHIIAGDGHCCCTTSNKLCSNVSRGKRPSVLATSWKEMQLPTELDLTPDLALRPRVSTLSAMPSGLDLAGLRKTHALERQEQLPSHQPKKSPIATISSPAKCTTQSPHHGASTRPEDGAPDSLPPTR